MASAGIAYNPTDPAQAAFLSALSYGETGGGNASTSPWTEGYGGANLSNAPTDQYGFPQWSGVGNTHAAGAYQFQPGTWSDLAQQYGLNFQNPQDQSAGAWYLAQQTYAKNTGGGSLESALQAGNFKQVQNALASIWPSVTGSGAAPMGLAQDLAQGIGTNGISSSAAQAIANDTGANQSSGGGSSAGGIVAVIQNFFVRGGLILVGGIVVIAALWMLLSNQGIVPSPKKLVESV